MASVRSERRCTLLIRSSIITLGFIVSSLFMAFRAFKDADVGLARFYLPVIGEMAEKWVGEE